MGKKTIYETLRNAGLTKEGACGLMGNMMAESTLKSNIAQRGMTKLSDEQYTAAADNGLIDFVNDAVGYGLCQWTYNARKAKLLAFAQNRGVSVGDEKMQAEFCLKELREEYGGVMTLLQTSHDLLQCTQRVCVEYERPAVTNVGTRLEFAQQIMNEMADRGTVLAVSGETEEPSPLSAKFPPDPSVWAIQLVMQYNGYWGAPDGYKTREFFDNLRIFTDDMEKG